MKAIEELYRVCFYGIFFVVILLNDWINAENSSQCESRTGKFQVLFHSVRLRSVDWLIARSFDAMKEKANDDIIHNRNDNI